MKKILLYGNCQIVNAIPTIIWESIKDNYTIIKTKIVVELEEDDINYIDKIITDVDILISQPIGEIKNNCKTSLKYLLSKIKNECKVIIFPVCYLKFYYIDFDYIRYNNVQLNKPIAYHDKNIIKLFNEYNKLENITIEEIKHLIKKSYTNIVNNIDYYNKDIYDKLAINGIIELENRENEMKTKYENSVKYIKFIKISDYIINNYKDKLLFYSVNHPSKYILQYLSINILNELGLTNKINYDIDPLNNIKCILYKSIENSINFKIKDHQPKINNKNKIDDICNLYIDEYKKNKFMIDII